MRHRVALVAVLPLLAACGGVGDGQAGGANASCVGPQLDAHPPGDRDGGGSPTVTAGDELTVYGHWFTDVCNDTGYENQPMTPLAPVRLTLTLPDGTTVPLGVFTPAGPDLGFSVPVHIPARATPGAATVADDGGHSLRFAIRRG